MFSLDSTSGNVMPAFLSDSPCKKINSPSHSPNVVSHAKNSRDT